ncbi:MAG TPA: choice-of-anchor D domain-containing protein, partial [Candidatus Kapabacteria bacterium]
ISFRDTNIGIMVVHGGSILRTSNGGTSWTKRTSGTVYDLYSVEFTGGVEFTVVGQLGTILRSTDGGYNWLNQSSGTKYRLLSVMFVNDSTGWIVGDSGIILHTTNGGISTPSLSHLDAPSAIDFGDIDVGSMIDTTIELHNSGSAAYDIGYYTLNDAANGFKLLDTSLHIIYVDAIGKIKLRFAPVTEMTYQAMLTISRYETVNLYIDTIKLFGKGINSKLSVSQPALDFGNVDSASSKTLSFNLVNKVTSSIVINSVSITGSNQFSMVSPSTPFTISGGEQSEISVKYSPTINGTAKATLSIVAEDGTTVLVPLSGFGVGKGDTTSSFTRLEPKKVDRIVVAPNPSSGTSSLYIEASSYYETVTLSFLDETGREIGTQFIGSLAEGKNSIPLTLPQTSGLIFIRVLSAGENIGTVRAILNK